MIRLLPFFFLSVLAFIDGSAAQRPNILLIMADDMGCGKTVQLTADAVAVGLARGVAARQLLVVVAQRLQQPVDSR